MSLNNLKKTLVFSSDEAKSLIEGLLADDAAITGRTLSATWEHHLLYEPLLPQNPNAAGFIKRLYSQGDSSVGKVVSDVAGYLAGGIGGRSLYDNGYTDIISFCRAYGGDTNVRFPDIYAVEYLEAQTEGVTAHMRFAATKSDDAFLTSDLQREAERMDKEIAASKETLSIDALYFYEVLSAFPEQLRDYGRAYRLISWLARYCRWIDTPRSRYDVTHLLINISSKWE